MSSKIIDAIVSHLSKNDDSILKDVKVARACLNKLKAGHHFNYSLEIGVKTLNFTKNLNPRHQNVEHKHTNELLFELESQATVSLEQDKAGILRRLNQFKNDLV